MFRCFHHPLLPIKQALAVNNCMSLQASAKFASGERAPQTANGQHGAGIRRQLFALVPDFRLQLIARACCVIRVRVSRQVFAIVHVPFSALFLFKFESNKIAAHCEVRKHTFACANKAIAMQKIARNTRIDAARTAIKQASSSSVERE